VLAMSRLLGGMLHASAEAERVEGSARVTAAAMREFAVDSFPDLHV